MASLASTSSPKYVLPPEKLIGGPCQTPGGRQEALDVAENDILRVAIHHEQQTGVDEGLNKIVETKKGPVELYMNGSTLRCIHRYSSQQGSQQIRMACSNARDYTRQTGKPQSPLLLQDDLDIGLIRHVSSEQRADSPIQRYNAVNNEINDAMDKFLQTKSTTEMALISQENDDKNCELLLYKTESFLSWLASGIDRLHDIREFLPADVVRNALYNQWIEELPTAATYHNDFLKLLSDFFLRPMSGLQGLWGTNNGQELTFEEYVKTGGPMLELVKTYVYPPLNNKSMMVVKEQLKASIIELLDELGLPLLKIADPTGTHTKIDVQRIRRLKKPEKGSDQAIGLRDNFQGLKDPAAAIKTLFLHAAGMKPNDQKYIDLEGVQILLFVDAYKRPFYIPPNSLEESAKTFTSAIDAANAKYWSTKDDQPNFEATRAAEYKLLFPSESQTRTLIFRRMNAGALVTMQKAVVEEPVEKVATTIVAPFLTVYAQIATGVQGRLDTIWQESNDDKVEYVNKVCQQFCESGKRSGRLCSILRKICETQEWLANLLKTPHKSNTRLIKEVKKLEKMELALVGTQINSGIPFLATKDIKGTFDDYRLQHIVGKIENIQKGSLPIECIRKNEAADILRWSAVGVTSCEYYFLVPIIEDDDGRPYIDMKDGKLYPFGFLEGKDATEQRWKKFIVQESGGKQYIPLATVLSLEEAILTHIADEMYVRVVSIPGGSVAIEDIVTFIKHNSGSLNFLQGHSRTFLDKLDHFMIQSYNGTNPETDRISNYHSIAAATGTHQIATVASEIFSDRWKGEPPSPVINDNLENSLISQELRAMDAADIVKRLLVAAMSSKTFVEEGDDMVVTQEVDYNKKLQNKSAFTVIDHTIRNSVIVKLLPELLKILEPLRIKETSPFYHQLAAEINHWIENNLYHVLFHTCHNKDAGSTSLSTIVIDFLNSQFPAMVHKALSMYGKDVQDSAMQSLMESGVLEATMEEFKNKLVQHDRFKSSVTLSTLCDGEGSFLHEQHIHYRQEHTAPTMSSEKEPSMDEGKDEEKAVFDTKYNGNLALITDIATAIANNSEKPIVTLTSMVTLQGTPYEERHAGPVSVKKAHKMIYAKYKDLVPQLLKGKSLNIIKQLWVLRMQHDFGEINPTTNSPYSDAGFNQVISDEAKRRRDTEALLSGGAMLVDQMVDDEDEDDESEILQSGKKMDPFSSDVIVGWSRALDGVSDVNKSSDRGQRCLQYCIKSAAYACLYAQISDDAALKRQLKSFGLTDLKINSSVKFCMDVRSIEGLKSSGDLLPLIQARIMNLCYSSARINGVPQTTIFGSTSFDKIQVIIGHILHVPDIMIGVKGGIEALGGFRGHTAPNTNPRSTVVILQNNPELIESLNPSIACSDMYWVEASNKGPLLILIISVLIQDLIPDSFGGFLTELALIYKKYTGVANIAPMAQLLHTYIDQMREKEGVEKFKVAVNTLNKQISDLTRNQWQSIMINVTHRCLDKRAGWFKSAPEAEARRGVIITFILDYDGDINSIVQFLTPSVQFSSVPIMGTVVDPHAKTGQPDTVMGTVVDHHAKTEQLDTVMGTVVDPEKLYKKWIADVKEMNTEVGLGKSDGMTIREQKKALANIQKVIEEGSALEKIFTHGPKRFVLNDGLTKMSTAHAWLLHGIEKGKRGGTKSRKRHHRRRRKTRRKKKRRKRKTIRKRRKKGRKTRRK